MLNWCPIIRIPCRTGESPREHIHLHAQVASLIGNRDYPGPHWAVLAGCQCDLPGVAMMPVLLVLTALATQEVLRLARAAES